MNDDSEMYVDDRLREKETKPVAPKLGEAVFMCRIPWWCWIVNDPFFPSNNEAGECVCCLCDMVYDETTSWDGKNVFECYHRPAGRVPNPFSNDFNWDDWK